MKLAKVDDCAYPYAACGIILKQGNKIAMVLRKNTSWLNGYYGLPGGRVEWGETFKAAAIREAKEETGVDIKEHDLLLAHTCHRHEEDTETFKDWVDMLFKANTWKGEPTNAEPHKSEKLDWIDINNLPENTIPVLEFCLEKIAKGEKYSEYGWAS